MRIYETGLVNTDISGSDTIGLEELQRAVGGYIEVISFGPVLPNGRELDMYVNDEGRLAGMAVNPVASLVAAIFGRTVLIAGPAVLASVDEEGATLRLTDEEEQFIIGKLEEALARMDGEVA